MRTGLLIISGFIFLCSHFLFGNSIVGIEKASLQPAILTNDSTVLKLFVNKCNACHLKKKQIVFTPENMAFLYLLIEEQVIIKQRMPKGKDYLLTDSEKLLIKNWVEDQKQSTKRKY